MKPRPRVSIRETLHHNQYAAEYRRKYPVTKKIKFLKNYGGTIKAGDVMEISAAKADKIIAQGYAVAYVEPKPIQKADAVPVVETAEAPQVEKSKPRRSYATQSKTSKTVE